VSLDSTLKKFGQALAANLQTFGAEAARFEIGEEHIRLGENIGERMNKPSVVLVPIGAPEIEQFGTMRSPTSRVTPAALSQPEELAVRDEHVDAYIWAKTLLDTEVLMNHFVAGCRVGATAHSFKPLATRWAMVDPDKADRGTYCILRFKTRIPFTFEPSQIAKAPFTQAVTGQLNVNGNLTDEIETPAA
jgi:hypothetical protein